VKGGFYHAHVVLGLVMLGIAAVIAHLGGEQERIPSVGRSDAFWNAGFER